ncbi:MAG: class I SAM-dependent methyltransferase [Oligoflexia bacterium]|nr:class I SAM-dependent methyltransferase [Oligoflexia bacterium]
MLTKKEFWNQKISSWEISKYKKSLKYLDINSSVKFRLYLASALLKQVSQEKHVLELGCGSGWLWDHIKLLNMKSYKGVDFSKIAIENFQKKVQNFKGQDRISLSCEDCIKNTYSADIVVSLGLLDWIPTEKIRKIAENYKESWYLHSFSEKRYSFSQIMHVLYSRVNYKIWTPQYRSADELLSIFGPRAKIYRHPKLSFGAFIYHLPPHIKFQC